MALTYSNIGKPDSIGRRKVQPTLITFDSSYARGGESVGASGSGLNISSSRIIGVEILGKNAFGRGFNVEYDYANTKLLVTQPTPSLVVEESVTISSHTGTMNRVPGYILSIHASAGGTTGACDVIPVGETPATTQCAVNFLTGGLTFATADAVTTALVTYIPLGVGPFIEANRVIDESNAGTNDTTRDLANRAALIQYVWNDTAGTLPTLIPVGESPASGEAAIDINNSGATTITVNAAQDDATYKITYWKHSAIGAAYGWTDQADISITSDAIVVPEALDLSGTLIPGFGVRLVSEATATNKQERMLGPSGAAAADVAVWNPAKNTFTFANADSLTTCEIPYIVLNPAQFGNQFTEVPAATDLSGLVVRANVWFT